jgi:hypothetical protein
MRARLRIYDTAFVNERGLLPFVAGTLRFSCNVDGDGDITFDAKKSDVDALPAWVCGLRLELETSPGTWTPIALYSPRNDFTSRAGTGIVTLQAQETLGVWARETLVMPEEMAGVTWPSMPDEREMGWMASAYDPADDQFGEPWALCIGVPGSVPESAKRPKGWPSPCPAKWITASGNWEEYQRKYFRAWITIPPGGRQKVRFYLSAEESSTLYVAGRVVIEEDFYEGEWRNKYRARTIQLEPGTYAVAITNDSKGDKKAAGFSGYDPTLFAAGLMSANGTISQWLLVSDAGTFRACRRTDDPDQPAGRPPGPTPGQVLTYIIGEARAREATGWDNTSNGFTGAVDSYGQPWSECVTERKWRVGDDYFDIIQALSETDDLDCWIDPVTFVLHAAPKRGQHRPGMTWTAAQVASLQVAGSGYRGTWVMGETAHSNWYSRWRTGVRRREYMLTMGQATSRWTAHRILNASLRDGWRWDGTAKLRIPKPGWIPFVDYQLGDWGALDYTDQQQQVAVQGISGEGSEGGILWQVELTEYPPAVVDTVAR